MVLGIPALDSRLQLIPGLQADPHYNSSMDIQPLPHPSHQPLQVYSAVIGQLPLTFDLLQIY